MIEIDGCRLDIDKVHDRLYQGGRIRPDCSYDGFSMIVLCAKEIQPDLPRFRGRIVRAAFDDTLNPSSPELARIAGAALAVVTEIQRGGRVLVTCAAGLNRSGVVTGLALRKRTGMSADHAIRMIRAARSKALFNKTFEQIVRAGLDAGRSPTVIRCA